MVTVRPEVGEDAPAEIARAHVPQPAPDTTMIEIEALYDRIGMARGLAIQNSALVDDGVTAGSMPQGYVQVPLGEHENAAKTRRRTYAKIDESIVWDPKRQAVPIITPTTDNSQLIALTLEDRLWSTGQYGSTVFGLGSVNLLDAMRISVRMYNTSPLAKRIINAYTYMTVGEGVNVSWDEKAGRHSGARKIANWARVRRDTGFDGYVKHIVRMTFLGGEAFTVLKRAGRNAARRVVGMHYVEPDRVPLIFVDAEDVDDVSGYQIVGMGGQTRVALPEDVIHHRVNRLGNVPRGIPVLLPALRNLREWDLFVENRAWVNRSRARFPAFVRVKGGPAQIAAAKASWKGLPAPGKVVILPEGQDMEFPPHNVGASDVADDRKLLAETIAAAVDLPVFVLIPTASDGNYSASIVAESPMVRMFLELQELFRPDIERLIAELTGEKEGFHVDFPPIIRRGFGEQAAGLSVGIQNGFLSKQTAWERIRTGDRPWMGPGGEFERITREAQALAQATGDAMLGFGGHNDAPSPNQKRADGGVGSVPTGTAQGAGAGSEGSPSAGS